jgi:hypothetical protein
VGGPQRRAGGAGAIGPKLDGAAARRARKVVDQGRPITWAADREGRDMRRGPFSILGGNVWLEALAVISSLRPVPDRANAEVPERSNGAVSKCVTRRPCLSYHVLECELRVGLFGDPGTWASRSVPADAKTSGANLGANRTDRAV